jgi:hypothetical protein
MSIRAHAAILAMSLAPALWPATALAQTVQFVIVGKHMENAQTSATDVRINPTPQGPLYGGPYGFSVNVEGLNVGQLAAPVVTGPFNVAALGSFLNGGKLVFNAEDASWRLGSPNANDWGSPTRADLDSKFGSGTYVVNVAGTSVPLQLSGDAYPNAPVLTLTGGTWTAGKYQVDPGKPITITTNAFTGYGSHVDDRIGIFVEGVGEQGQFHSAVPNSNTFSFTIPASALVSGREFVAGATFNAVVDSHPVAALPGSLNVAIYSVSTTLKIAVSVPVFPMVVSGSITPTVASITADIKYRPQDVGTNGSVYVFALAPAAIVKNALVPALDGYVGPVARGAAKDTPLPCVLAQLTGSGLTAASAGNLAPYLSGVLGSQGASVAVLNGVSTSLIQGSVFYVGYGANSTAMINDGINRSAATVPGAVTCQPQAPQSGWWWNRNEPGRGFSIEAADNRLFMAGYLYDASGRSTWTVAGGQSSLDGSLFHGPLQNFSGGQTLTGTYKAPAGAPSGGAITLTFTDASNGTLVWAGGAIPITRFDIAAPSAAPLPPFVPQNGWWWSPTESGRGYFMEFSNNVAFIAGYMYDATGNPLWYLASGAMSSPQTFSANWTQWGNGQTLTGPFVPAAQINANVGPLSIRFDDASHATLTLPGNRSVAITRFGF